MKILILVLSSHVPPYDKLYETQRATWDSVVVEGVETVYYWNDDWQESYASLRDAVAESLRRAPGFIFRTNSSSYVDKKLLVEVAKTLPREGCYAGVDGGGFASGSGFFMSYDVAQILYNHLFIRGDSGFRGEEDDKFTGWVLSLYGVPVLSTKRYDFYARGEDPEAIRRAYHVRCKGSDAEREEDVAAIRVVHEIKTKETP